MLWISALKQNRNPWHSCWYIFVCRQTDTGRLPHWELYRVSQEGDHRLCVSMFLCSEWMNEWMNSMLWKRRTVSTAGGQIHTHSVVAVKSCLSRAGCSSKSLCGWEHISNTFLRLLCLLICSMSCIIWSTELYKWCNSLHLHENWHVYRLQHPPLLHARAAGSLC